MLKMLAATLVVVATPAPAQVITSYSSSTQAQVTGDADKIVCKREETIGTRLGAKKVCLTVSEWQENERLQRNQIDRMQAGACVPQSIGTAPAGCVKGQFGD